MHARKCPTVCGQTCRPAGSEIGRTSAFGSIRIPVAIGLLVVSAVLLETGCAETTAALITIDQILQAASLTIEAFKLVQQYSSDTSTTVSTDYREAGPLITAERVEVSQVTGMEGRYRDMQAKAQQFSTALDKTAANAGNLFKLMEERDGQATVPVVKAQLLSDTAKRKSEFYKRLDIAKTECAKLNESIANYNTILIVMQHRAAMQSIEKYIVDVDDIANKATALNASVQEAVEQGLALINPKQIEAVASTQSGQNTQMALQTLLEQFQKKQDAGIDSAGKGQSSPDTNIAALDRSCAATDSDRPTATQPLVPGTSTTIPQGVPLCVQTSLPLTLGNTAQAQDSEFDAVLASRLTAGGTTLAEKGAQVKGRFRQMLGIDGYSYVMEITLDSVATAGGHQVPIKTVEWTVTGTSGRVIPAGQTMSFPLATPLLVTQSASNTLVAMATR